MPRTRANRRHGRCTRHSRVGSISMAASSGQHTLTLQGRIGRRGLGAGSYQLTGTLVVSGQSPQTATVAFRILP